VRGFGVGVSGCESRWRICGGNVFPVAIEGVEPDAWDIDEDFRRDEMRSFTVGAASLSVLRSRLAMSLFFRRRGRGRGIPFVEPTREAVAGDCREG
jgi:hypothetical protein